MKLLALTITLVLSQILFAQDTSRIFIAAGKKFSDVVTPVVMFRYKEFKPGRVLFKDGSLNDARLNYNLFNGEIVFIAPTGDTMAIATEQMLNIQRVSIDTISYVYNKGYLEVMMENTVGALARKQRYFVVSNEKIGGYNMPSPTSSIDSYTSFSDRQNTRHDLAVRENIMFQLKTDYYVGDSYKLFLPVNRKNLEKIFFKKRKELESYLKDHELDFKKEKDVKDLFLFMTEQN